MSETSSQPSWRQMTGRNPDEQHRAATPLELLFDLTFVIAVAMTASQLHHNLAEGHIGSALFGYSIVFFGIWWAWMNFTWFASAYDTDDVPYRLLTLLQMGGVLVFATGIPALFNQFDFTITITGYIIMRGAMIAQWIRAAVEDPESRSATIRYAVGIAIVQLCWIAFLWIPGDWKLIVMVGLILAELGVPAWAEFSGQPTAWHPGHITERYGLFTIIVLGEVMLATTTAIQSTLASGGLSSALLMVAVGSLLLIFGLWWSYFKHSTSEITQSSLKFTLVWGYGHYFIFAAGAALGAGLQVVVDTLEGTSRVSPVFAAFTVAIPVALFLIVYGLLMTQRNQPFSSISVVLATALLILFTALAASIITLPVSVLLIALLVTLLLAYHLIQGSK